MSHLMQLLLWLLASAGVQTQDCELTQREAVSCEVPAPPPPTERNYVPSDRHIINGF